MTDKNFTPSIIYTAATAELNKQVEKELEVEDPTIEKAEAAINKFLGDDTIYAGLGIPQNGGEKA